MDLEDDIMFGLYATYTDPMRRYLLGMEPFFDRMDEDAKAELLLDSLQLRGFLDALSTNPDFFHNILLQLVEEPWTAADMKRLARYFYVECLCPSIILDPGAVPAGELSATLAAERAELSRQYPAFLDRAAYDPRLRLVHEPLGEQHRYLLGETLFDLGQDAEGYLATVQDARDETVDLECLDPLFLSLIGSAVDEMRATQVRISMEGWPDALDRMAEAEANQISEVFVVLARYIVDVLAVRIFTEGGVSSDILEQQLQWLALDYADKRDDMLVAVHQPSSSCAALAEVFGWQAAAHIADRAVQSLRDLDEEDLAQKMAEAFEALMPEGDMQRTTMALDRVMRMEVEDPIAAMRECEVLAEGAENRGDVAARLRFLSTRGWLAARAGMMDEARVMFDRTLPLFQTYRSSPEVIPAIALFLPLCALLGELSASRNLIEHGLKMTASRPELAEQRRVLLIEMDLLRKYEAKDRGKAPRRR